MSHEPLLYAVLVVAAMAGLEVFEAARWRIARARRRRRAPEVPTTDGAAGASFQCELVVPPWNGGRAAESRHDRDFAAAALGTHAALRAAR